MKRLIWIIVLLCAFCGISLAAKNDNNCNSTATDKDWNYILLKNFWYNYILWEDDTKKAFDNLKKFCCQRKLISGTGCGNVDTWGYYPSSASLFDHMFDIYMRKLDAKQKNENWEDLMLWVQPDPDWKAWRDFITNVGNNPDWLVPTKITDEFNKYWKSDTSSQIMSFNIEDKGVDNRKNDISWKITDFPDWKLVDKYNNACDVIMYLSIQTKLVNDWWKLESDINTKESEVYSKCKELVKNRINAEDYYVQSLIKEKSNTLLMDNVNTYLSTYFLETKMTELQKSLLNSRTMFAEIVKWVSRLIKNCS